METRSFQRAVVVAINAELAARQLTRLQLAELTGINPQTLARAFRLERDLNMEQLGRITTSLGISPGRLLDKAVEYRTVVDPPELLIQLENVRSIAGLSKRALASLEREVRNNYYAELNKTQPEAPPSPLRNGL